MKKNNIIIIEDDVDVREFLSTFLKEKGYHIIEAENGAEAKKIIAGKQPDLVISDLLLPGEHGLEVIKFIKDNYFLPVIAVSGIYSENEIAKDIEELYIDEFIKKPIDTVKLMDAIEKIFSKG